MRRGLSYHNRRSAGGYNPFSQLGPTLDLIFAGNVTNLSDPNGFTLDANFLAPQYLIGEQYTIWETGVGLVSKTFSQIITFTRASTATFFNSSGVLTSAAIDAPRLDYNPSTLAAQGLLIEESRTNLLSYSEDFGNAAWTKSGATVSTDTTTAPTGTTIADSLIENTSTGQHRVFRTVSGTTNTNPYTLSVFAKANTRTRIYLGIAEGTTFVRQGNAIFDLSAGTVVFADGGSGGATGGSATITAVGNGWYRCTYTLTLGGTDTTVFSDINLVSTGTTINYTGDGTSGLFIWGAQLEAGAFPTSYIPTTTTALTRSADVAAVNTLSPWYNATEGTLFVQAQDMSDAAHGTSQPRAASINNGTTSNTIDVSRLPASAQGRARVDDAGANQFNSLNSAWPLATQAKVALAYKVNDFAACLGGGTVFTDTSGTVPAVTALSIGNVPVGGGNGWVGWIQRVAYYPRRLSNAELQALTA